VSNKPTINLKQVRKRLKSLGFELIREGKHQIWGKDGKIVPVSKGNQQVGETLLKSICRQADISVDDFLKL
jgi:predicted RNA binding protein YcfA (HicA-like mRNA interferase family)